MVLRRASSTGGRNRVTRPDTVTPPDPPSPSALRMRRFRERRRDGLRCMTIELRETEITTLIRKGLLNEDVRNDLRAVKTTFYSFLDRTLDLNS
jgi:hypothetical protein